MSKVQHSEACCTLPPFTGSDYKPIGKVERIPGFNTNTAIADIDSDIDVYVTGKNDAEIGLICIYGTLSV